MDCEKFETAMLDELYGELDELTSAAAARHIAGCTRCAALVGGLRATRRVATIPLLDPPADLEERILKAAGRVVTTVPLGRRVARSISIAGDWAMRPQTAMAAVFMVMLGTSLLLLRGKSSRAPASAEMRVTEQGTPAPPGPVAGVAPQRKPSEPFVAPPVVPARRPGEPKTATAPGAGAPALDVGSDDSRHRAALNAQALAREEDGLASDQKVSSGNFAAAPPAANAGAGGSTGYAVPATAEREAPSPFDSALKLYQSARYDAASHAFDALSAADPSADLWTARAISEGKGCRAAVARFDKVAQRAAGSSPGWDALLEGALCYRSVGDFANARIRMNALLSVDSHKDRARVEIDRLSRMQAQGGGFAQPAAKATPRSQPAASPPNFAGQSP